MADGHVDGPSSDAPGVMSTSDGRRFAIGDEVRCDEDTSPATITEFAADGTIGIRYENGDEWYAWPSGLTNDSAGFDAIPDDEVLIARTLLGREAWEFYQAVNGFIWPSKRTIRSTTSRIAFYSASRRQVMGVVPQIVRELSSCEITAERAASLAFDSNPEARQLGLIIDAALEWGWQEPRADVFLLTRQTAPETVTFDPVLHEGGSTWQFRYLLLRDLVDARTTSDLRAYAAGEDE